MTAFAVDLTPDRAAMDGIPELIDQWIKGEARRTNQRLGEKVGVSGTTIGRWRSEKNPPDEEYRDALADELGVTRAELDAAAEVTAERIYKREHGTKRRLEVVGGFPRDRWLKAVEEDDHLSTYERALLCAFTGYYVDDDLVRVRSLDRLASDWGLELETVRDALPGVLVSGYVRRVDVEDVEGWMLKLRFPR